MTVTAALPSFAVVIDFEATCDDLQPPKPQEIIEFPSVLVSLDRRAIVDEFQSFVRPQHHPSLTRFCTEFTGIRQANVDSAPDFRSVFTAHQKWLENQGLDEKNALIVTCGDWDFGTMFPAQCRAADPRVQWIPPFYRRWHNIKRLFTARSGGKAPGMTGMLKALGLELKGRHHRGIDDCRNIARLLLALLGDDVEIAVTGSLPLPKHPPLALVLRLGDQRREVILNRRSLETLRRLAQREFRQRVQEIQGPDSRGFSTDEQLADLQPGTTCHVIPTEDHLDA